MSPTRLRLQGDFCRALHRAPDLAAVLLRQRFLEDSEYDDAALEGMLRDAHRVHSHHSQREDLSVSLSSSSVSDRTGRPVGDRAVRPAEQSSQDAQIGTLLDNQKEQILAECQAEINRHEFQAAYDRRSLRKLGEIVESQQEELHCARAEEVQRRDRQLLHGRLLQQNLWNYVKLINEVSLKWKS